MIFEKGWFLRKMNKYAPKGFRFVARGKEGRIALYAVDVMGKQEPAGPFVSCFSFEMLDMLFGGLLTRRSANIDHGSSVADNMHDYDIAQIPIFAKTQQAAEAQYAKYRIYRSIIRPYMDIYKRKPYMAFPETNALLIQGLQDSKAFLPESLSKRMQDYVNKYVWYAIESVFASMSICNMNYYQDLYRKKMQLLKIDPHNDISYDLQQQQQQIKLCKKLEQEIKKCTDVPLQWWKNAMTDAIREKADEQTINHIQYMIDKFTAKIENLKVLLKKNTVQEPYRPARDILYDTFHDKDGGLVIPHLSKNKYMQMLQVACMNKRKIKTK